MSARWWQLPGPAGFVANVVGAWRHGCHTVLWLPDGMYPGLRQACRAEVDRTGPTYWAAHIELHGQDEHPLDVLRCEFGSDDARDAASIVHLFASSTAAGGIVWIDGVQGSVWPAWRRILADVDAATRALEPAQRTMLCVALEGLPEGSRPPSDVCLNVFTWADVVDSLDALIFAVSLCRARNCSDDDRMLRALTIAHLALWDGQSAEMLADLTNEQLCQPEGPLREFAADLAWHPDSRKPCWQDGNAGTWHGRHALHSAWLATCGDQDELRRRHWKAHIQALLPYVEERRAELLDQVRSRLRVPYETSTGDVVTRIEELEIGHLYSQLANDSYVDHRIRRKIRLLRDIRNALSHLKPVAPELLFHRALEKDFNRR